MKKITGLMVLLLMSLYLSGCIFVERYDYEINMKDKLSGTVKITFHDIKSDASTEEDFEKDVEFLYEELFGGDEYLNEVAGTGKTIIDKKLYIEGDKLIGEIVYSFDDINTVESMQFSDGFYYLTTQPRDSIYSTNGKLIKQDEYNRILWDEGMETLKFSIYVSPAHSDMRELDDYYDEYINN